MSRGPGGTPDPSPGASDQDGTPDRTGTPDQTGATPEGNGPPGPPDSLKGIDASRVRSFVGLSIGLVGPRANLAVSGVLITLFVVMLVGLFGAKRSPSQQSPGAGDGPGPDPAVPVGAQAG